MAAIFHYFSACVYPQNQAAQFALGRHRISLSSPHIPASSRKRLKPITKLLGAGFLISCVPSVILDSAEVSVWRKATLFLEGVL
jgi:hypothetical protein